MNEHLHNYDFVMTRDYLLAYKKHNPMALVNTDPINPNKFLPPAPVL